MELRSAAHRHGFDGHAATFPKSSGFPQHSICRRLELPRSDHTQGHSVIAVRKKQALRDVGCILDRCEACGADDGVQSWQALLTEGLTCANMPLENIIPVYQTGGLKYEFMPVARCVLPVCACSYLRSLRASSDSGPPSHGYSKNDLLQRTHCLSLMRLVC